nr:hypothetical protein [Moraxella osloensis]
MAKLKGFLIAFQALAVVLVFCFGLGWSLTKKTPSGWGAGHGFRWCVRFRPLGLLWSLLWSGLPLGELVNLQA